MARSSKQHSWNMFRDALQSRLPVSSRAAKARARERTQMHAHRGAWARFIHGENAPACAYAFITFVRRAISHPLQSHYRPPSLKCVASSLMPLKWKQARTAGRAAAEHVRQDEVEKKKRRKRQREGKIFNHKRAFYGELRPCALQQSNYQDSAC